MTYDFGYFHYDVAFVVVGWVENLQQKSSWFWLTLGLQTVGAWLTKQRDKLYIYIWLILFLFYFGNCSRFVAVFLCISTSFRSLFWFYIDSLLTLDRWWLRFHVCDCEGGVFPLPIPQGGNPAKAVCSHVLCWVCRAAFTTRDVCLPLSVILKLKLLSLLQSVWC